MYVILGHVWGAIMSSERYDKTQARQKRLTIIAGPCTYAGFKRLKGRIVSPITATSGRKLQQADQGKFKLCSEEIKANLPGMYNGELQTLVLVNPR